MRLISARSIVAVSCTCLLTLLMAATRIVEAAACDCASKTTTESIDVYNDAGTLVASFQCIQEAVNSLPGTAAGFSIRIPTGTYFERVSFASKNGTAVKPIVMRPKTPSDIVVIDGAVPELQQPNTRWTNAGIPNKYRKGTSWVPGDADDAASNDANVVVYSTTFPCITTFPTTVTASFYNGPFDPYQTVLEKRIWTYGDRTDVNQNAQPPDPTVDQAFIVRHQAAVHTEPSDSQKNIIHPTPVYGLWYDKAAPKVYIELIDNTIQPPDSGIASDNPNLLGLNVSRFDSVISISSSSFIRIENIAVIHGGKSCIEIANSNNCTFDNLVVRGAQYGFLMRSSSPGSNNTIKNCLVSDYYDNDWIWEDVKITGKLAVAGGGSSFSSVFEKTMEGTGILINGGSNNVIDSCLVRGYFNGIGQNTDSAVTSSFEVRRCVVFNNLDDAIELEGDISGAKVHQNLAYDCHVAVSMTPTSNATLAHVYRNNLFSTKTVKNDFASPTSINRYISGHVITEDPPYTFKLTAGGRNLRVYNNTAWSFGNVVGNDSTTNTLVNVWFLNNIFYVNDKAPDCPNLLSSSKRVCVNNSGSSVNQMLYDGNLYYKLNGGSYSDGGRIVTKWMATTGLKNYSYSQFSTMKSESTTTTACVNTKWETNGQAVTGPGIIFRYPLNYDVGLTPYSSPALNSNTPACLFTGLPDDVSYAGSTNMRDIGAHELWSNDGGAFFLRGDANQNGMVEISDASKILNYAYGGDYYPLGLCLDAGDANDDGTVNMNDASYVLAFLFSNGPRPPMPSFVCGPDPTIEQSSGGLPSLACNYYDYGACAAIPIVEKCPDN